MKGNTKASLFKYVEIIGTIADAGSVGKINAMQLAIMFKIGDFGLAAQNGFAYSAGNDSAVGI